MKTRWIDVWLLETLENANNERMTKMLMTFNKRENNKKKKIQMMMLSILITKKIGFREFYLKKCFLLKYKKTAKR